MHTSKFRIPLSRKPDDMIYVGGKIIAKHLLDALTSPLTPVDMEQMESILTEATAKNTLTNECNDNKEIAIEARDVALGIGSNVPGTVYQYVVATRDILLGIHKGLEHKLHDYGFDVVQNTGGTRIPIPRNARDLIVLATKILAKNTALSTASPIKGLNIVDFTAKTTTANTQHELAIKLNGDREEAKIDRDRLLGIAKSQKLTAEKTLRYYIIVCRDVLLGLNKGNEAALAAWGFTVHHGSTPPPAPPTAICLTGKITDLNHNPVNNANVKIVQLNVTVQSNAEGIYEFPMQKEGTYTVEVSKQNCETQLCAGIVIKAGTVRNLNVQLNSILGSIIANVFFNGQPLSGAVVAITLINLSAVTDNNGIANLNNIPAGTYDVLATATGKAPLTYPITIELNTISSITFNMVEQS